MSLSTTGPVRAGRSLALALLALALGIAGFFPPQSAHAATTLKELPPLPLTAVTAPGSVTGTGPLGEPLIYWVSSGTEAIFTVTDARTGARVRTIPMPKAGGSWTLTRHADGDIYIGTYGSGRLFRYSPGSDHLADLGVMVPGETFIWSTTSDGTGTIYGGTGQVGGHVFSYTPATGAVRDYGAFGDVDNPIIQRGVAAGLGRIWVGSGPVPRLTEIDAATGERTEIPLPDLGGQSYLMDIDLRGELLFVRASTSGSPQPMHVFDLRTRTWVDTIDAAAGLRVSQTSPDGRSTYFVRNQTLHRYDLGSRTWEATPFTGLSDARAFGWLDLQDPAWPGMTLVSTSYQGRVWRYNPTTGRGDTLVADVAGAPANIRAMAEGPDRRIYFGAYLAGGLASYDPRTHTTRLEAHIPQAESITSHEGAVYAGTYPRAEVWRFEPGRPVVAGENPRVVLDLYDEGQSRPWALASAGHHLAVGTVPHNGATGGLLALLDTTTGEHWSVEVAGGQSVVGLIHRNGIVYGTTSAFGGSGAPRPAVMNGHVFAYDIAQRRMLWTVNPVPGEGALGQLAFDKQGKLWTGGPMTLHRLDPATGNLEDSHSYGSYPWGSVEYLWVAQRLWIDPYTDRINVTTQGAAYSVDPATFERTRDFRPASDSITTNEGHHYTARDAKAWQWQTHEAHSARADILGTPRLGAPVRVALSGFGPHEPVTLRLRPSAQPLADVVVDDTGSAVVEIRIPLATPLGAGAIEVERPLTRGIVRTALDVGREHCDRVVTRSSAQVRVATGTVVCITDADVRGGVRVAAGGQVFVRTSTVAGGISAAGADAVWVTGSRIRGDVVLSGVRDHLLADNRITGEVVR